MGIPEDIRKVPRPKNTVVVKSGSGYRVRKRIGCKRIEGRCVPIEGGYIGSIIDYKYVPDDPIKKTGYRGRVDIKNCGREKCSDSLNGDILEKLSHHYNQSESIMNYVIATLRAIYPGIRDYQLNEYYKNSFLSVMYPDLNLSKNSVSNELKNLGKEYSRIRAFMRARVCELKDNDTLIIDGCLKQDHSYINSFSQVSRKTRARKHKDNLIMYAYSSDKNEPICSKIYQGNMVDARAIGDFIKSNGIKKGLIVADKGFTLSAVLDATKDLPELHHLIPLKKDSKLIADNDMYAFDSKFFDEYNIECKKVKCDGYWLYSYRDPDIAKDDEDEYLDSHNSEEDLKRLSELRETFGTIVFQSDLDAPASKMYSVYKERWLIELLYKFYQTELDMDDTRVNCDYSVIGSDFIDFLAALMGSRILNRFRDIKEMEKWTFKMSMDFLNRAKMVRVDDDIGWEMNRLPLTDAELLAKLGVIDVPIVPTEVKKRGRPTGRKDQKPRKTRSDKGTRRSTQKA